MVIRVLGGAWPCHEAAECEQTSRVNRRAPAKSDGLQPTSDDESQPHPDIDSAAWSPVVSLAEATTPGPSGRPQKNSVFRRFWRESTWRSSFWRRWDAFRLAGAPTSTSLYSVFLKGCLTNASGSRTTRSAHALLHVHALAIRDAT